jgi:hypothetical protein
MYRLRNIIQEFHLFFFFALYFEVQMADSKKPMSYAAASSKFVGGTKNSQKNPAQREKVVFGDTTPVSTAPTKV